jgi:hypothetical protein
LKLRRKARIKLASLVSIVTGRTQKNSLGPWRTSEFSSGLKTPTDYSAEFHGRFDELRATSFFTLAKPYFHFPSK